jgi:hypothetical protein
LSIVLIKVTASFTGIASRLITVMRLVEIGSSDKIVSPTAPERYSRSVCTGQSWKFSLTFSSPFLTTSMDFTSALAGCATAGVVDAVETGVAAVGCGAAEPGAGWAGAGGVAAGGAFASRAVAGGAGVCGAAAWGAGDGVAAVCPGSGMMATAKIMPTRMVLKIRIVFFSFRFKLRTDRVFQGHGAVRASLLQLHSNDWNIGMME